MSTHSLLKENDMQIKYDLAKMLKEVKDDKKVFQEKDNYWASQGDIQELLKKMKKKGKK